MASSRWAGAVGFSHTVSVTLYIKGLYPPITTSVIPVTRLLVLILIISLRVPTLITLKMLYAKNAMDHKHIQNAYPEEPTTPSEFVPSV
jgi:hypothetical protein